MKTTKKILSLLLVVAMIFTLAVPVFAAEGKTATKITAAKDLVSGDYIMVADNGIAMNVIDGTWVTYADLSAGVDPATAPVWTLTVDGSSVKIADANGKFLAPKGGNANGISVKEYAWAVSFDNGAFVFSGTGDDTVYLANNPGDPNGHANCFRAYKTSTVGDGSNYPFHFSLYKLSAAPVAEPAVVLEDTGCWGESWPNAYNMGWRYENFDVNTITGITCGMLDKDGILLVEYTADAEQVAWQLENGYVTAAGQSSAPFYQAYDGAMIPMVRDYDWTVQTGPAFKAWQPATFYLTVTTATDTYELSREYNGPYAEVTDVKGDYDGQIVILHSNDVHGAIDGYANMAGLKTRLENLGATVIVVDAGDYSQGSTSVSLSKGANAVDLMNLVGYDVVTLGNHEFDYGWPQLKENLSKADFQVVCADVFENGELIYKGHTIVEKDGVKIGFFGMETPEAQTKVNPALIKGLSFLAEEDMYAAAQAQVNALKEEGADLVICLSHLGIDAESEPNRSVDMLAKVEGIDFLIDGHSHSVLVEGPDGEAMQSTGTAFANIGCIIIDAAGKTIEENFLVPVDPVNTPADKTVAAAAKAITDEIDDIYGQVFAKSEVELNGDKAPNGNRDSETNMGDLICDSMLWTVMHEDGAIQPGVGGVVAITNGGGIRAWIHKGDITMKDVNTVLPFGNTVAVVYVTGAELLEALEASTYCTPTSVGGFPQVAGIDFTIATYKDYDANAETYPASTYYGPASIQRVTINSVNGEDFDPEATYAVVTNNFCAAGGDTYYAFAAATAQFDTGIPLDEALMAYISDELKGVVGEQYAEPQGRISIVSEEPEEPAEPAIEITDCGVWGETQPNAYNLGWKYVNFDLDSITGIRCGMMAQKGAGLIVEYTAYGDQLKYQKENGYITAEGLSSAPFYQIWKSADGDIVMEEMDDLDWSVEIGQYFGDWQPAQFYVVVETADGEEYVAVADYNGPYAEPYDPEAGELSGKTVILHTNDVHGAIEGYAKVAALKAEYEAKGAEVILVDAGDYSQGTTSVSLSKGANAIDMMNLVGYDYATLGNHEFDYGWPQLKENLSKADFQVLCADVFENGELLYDGHTIKDVNGVKIGFFGMETPEAQTKVNPALIKGLSFLAGDAMYAAAQAEVDALKAEGADVIICIGHLGVDGESAPNRSVDMLAKVEGVDFFIDGHSHTVMEAGPNGEAMQSTGTAFNNIGVIVIDNATKAIEDNYLVQLKHTELDENDKEVTVVDYEPEDAEVAAAAKAIIDEIDEIYGQVFAKSEVDLNGDKAPNGNRDSETNMGDLIADSMLWTVMHEDGAIQPGVGGVVAITNGGGIRAWIHEGDITMKDVNTVLPFGNTVAVVYVTGAELLEALEASTYCTPTSVGGFPQVAGIEFSIAVHNEYKANAETYPASTYYGPASINRVTINSVNGEPFDPEATYAVVTNNFCAAGGDTYYAFAAASAQFDTGIPLDEALMAYISDELDGVVGEQYLLPQGRITMEHVWTEWEVAYPCCYPGGGLEISECDICGAPGVRMTEENLDDHSNDPFSDIAKSWAHDYIIDDYVLGIVNGYEDGSFKPNGNVTRAEFITMLWRANGCDEADVSALAFADAGQFADWYAEAVAWGVENGIVKGYEDNTFRPNAVITRAEMATFTYRFLSMLAGPGDAAAKAPAGYADQANIPDWAADAVNCLNYANIMNGVGDNLFAPSVTATRAMAAAVVFRTLDFYFNVVIEEAA